MTNELIQTPYIDPDPDNFGGTPHLSDYWLVVTRRLWLVLIIFTVTTASSIWAISQQQTFYSSGMSLQVNDPSARQAGLVNMPNMGGMNFFVDPIQSEIQVLNSSAIREQVVDSVGLRLARMDGGPRSDLARNIMVHPDSPDGFFRLVYNSDGSRAQFNTPDGTTLAEATAGTTLDAGVLSFVLQRVDDEAPRAYDLEIIPRRSAAGEISLAAEPRIDTNIVDISLVHGDQWLTSRILQQAGLALRDVGAERIRAAARADRTFIQSQLDEANAKLQASRVAIQNFRTTQAFSSLSMTEQSLVAQGQRIMDEVTVLDRQRQVLSGLVDVSNGPGVVEADLVTVLAELPANAHAQVRALIQRIQANQTDLRRLVQEQRLSEGHPQVTGARTEIIELGSQLKEAARASLGVVMTSLADLDSREQEVLAQQARFPELEGQMMELEAQREIDAQSYSMIIQQLYQTQITEAAAAPYIDILDNADSAFAIPGRSKVNIVLGGLLGLILGIGAAFFLEYLDRTVRTSSDVESLLGIPVLGVIPRLRRLEHAADGADQLAGRGVPLVVAMDPLDPAAEAYRNLRMNLMFMSSEEEPIRTILFSSPGPSEGKSTTAVNFAVMLAQQGQRVLLIDSDLRRPSLHRALDLLREPGLTNLLIGDAEPRETVRPNVLPNLDFLPSGPFPPNPSELLNSKTMVRIIEEFEGRYDHVIIDSPPVLAVTDAAILAVHTDGAVVVLRSGETEQRAAERAVDQLRRLGVRVFGAVLNEVSAASPDESYYLQYYYAYTPTGTPVQSGWQRLREGVSKVRFFG